MTQNPNILWYCTDQQRFDTISALGNRYICTPNLDAFLATGTAFTHTYCQSPICTPSRASFLTGMYPSALSVNGNGIENFPIYYQDRLIPHILMELGYDCGLVGKLHLSSAALGQEKRVDDGYRYFQYSHDHKGPHSFGHDYAEWIQKRGVKPEHLMQQPVKFTNYRDGAETSVGYVSRQPFKTTSRHIFIKPSGVRRKQLILYRKIGLSINRGFCQLIHLIHILLSIPLGFIMNNIIQNNCREPIFAILTSIINKNLLI